MSEVDFTLDAGLSGRPYPALSAVLELLKPITWFAPMWAFMCGVVSSGAPLLARWPLAIAGIVLAGPAICATSQAVNDWFDRDVDAINEPDRPIPSGRIPGRWGLWIGVGWSALSLGLAAWLGAWVFFAAVLGLALAWAYSAPPPRLKQRGWWGPVSVALCYEGLAWFTGAAVMNGALPDGRVITLAGLYSFGAVGIMVLNDFKAVEGDRRLGVLSVPVDLGVENAAWLACFIMARAASNRRDPSARVEPALPRRRGRRRPDRAGRADAPPAHRSAEILALVQRHRHLPLCPGDAGERLRRGRPPWSDPMTSTPSSAALNTPLSWVGIVRLGLVQSALGAVVALTTSTLNRVMVVEAAMPAVLPAAFVAWHYVIQLSRPRWGYGSDMGRRRTPWIIGGMGILVLGAILATDAATMMAGSHLAGILLALLAYTMIGAGVGAAGTSLLALLASRVEPTRRPAAASITWIMMIVGIVVSAGVSGALAATLLGSAPGDGRLGRGGGRLPPHPSGGVG